MNSVNIFFKIIISNEIKINEFDFAIGSLFFFDS